LTAIRTNPMSVSTWKADSAVFVDLLALLKVMVAMFADIRKCPLTVIHTNSMSLSSSRAD